MRNQFSHILLTNANLQMEHGTLLSSLLLLVGFNWFPGSGLGTDQREALLRTDWSDRRKQSFRAVRSQAGAWERDSVIIAFSVSPCLRGKIET